MTKLTNERLEEIAKLEITEYSDGMDIAKDAYQSVGSSEIVLMARQLLAYEQAAKNPVTWVATDSEGFPEYNGHNEFSASCGAGTPLYAAPVFPKQPESESIMCWSCKKTITLTQRAEADGFCPLCDAEIELEPTQPVIPEHCQMTPDEMLCDFYEVSNWPDLVRELVKHVEQLQESAKRNVKPWEDTFPETLLPAYVDRITRDNDACRAEMLKAQPVSEPYKLPSGYALVPCKLTAENGAKSCMIGEFTEQTEISCPECFGDDECETCDGSGMIEVTVPVNWTTIKDIWAKGIEHFAAAAAQEQK